MIFLSQINDFFGSFEQYSLRPRCKLYTHAHCLCTMRTVILTVHTIEQTLHTYILSMMILATLPVTLPLLYEFFANSDPRVKLYCAVTVTAIWTVAFLL